MAEPTKSALPYQRFKVVIGSIGQQVSVPANHTPLYLNLFVSQFRNPTLLDVIELGRSFCEDVVNTFLELAKEKQYEEFVPSSQVEAIILDMKPIIIDQKLFKKSKRVCHSRVKLGATLWGNELNIEFSISTENKKIHETIVEDFSSRFDTSKYSPTRHSISFVSSAVPLPYTHTAVANINIQTIDTKYVRMGKRINITF